MIGMSLFSARSSSSKYKSSQSSTCRSYPPSGNRNGHPSPSNRSNVHCASSSSKLNANKKLNRTANSPRLSLPPPDIVLLVEDQESHEIRNVTLLSCDEARKALFREQQRRGQFILAFCSSLLFSFYCSFFLTVPLLLFLLNNCCICFFSIRLIALACFSFLFPSYFTLLYFTSLLLLLFQLTYRLKFKCH